MLGIIINPKSGKSRYRRQRLYLFNLLKQQHQAFTYRVTKYAAHATELARELVENGHNRILVLGGDGTLSEVIDGIMHAHISVEQRRQVVVGLMPRGTGNDWGRYWGLTRDYKRSLDIFFRTGKPQLIDIGCLKVWRNNEEERHYFVNSVGFGVDAVTVQRANVIKYYVGSHGINYLFGLLSAVFSHKPIPVHLTTDEGVEIDKPVFTMNVGNGPYAGGGIKQNPEADPRDGIFQTLFAARPSFKQIMKALPNLFNGKLKEIDFVYSFFAKQVHIQTDEHIAIEKDGILIDACGPYDVSIVPSALQMMVPPDND